MAVLGKIWTSSHNPVWLWDLSYVAAWRIRAVLYSGDSIGLEWERGQNLHSIMNITGWFRASQPNFPHNLFWDWKWERQVVRMLPLVLGGKKYYKCHKPVNECAWFDPLLQTLQNWYCRFLWLPQPQLTWYHIPPSPLAICILPEAEAVVWTGHDLTVNIRTYIMICRSEMKDNLMVHRNYLPWCYLQNTMQKRKAD